MPRASYNVSRQRSRGNAITINGLLTWRAKRLRGLRVEPDSQADHQADIAAIDRVLVNVLGFTGDIEALTRDYRREALFKRNELRRMVCDVLREANEPLTARQITERVIARKSLELRPGSQSKQWINRVRKICQKLPFVDTTIAGDGFQAWLRRATLCCPPRWEVSDAAHQST